MKKILILGSSGQLGTDMNETLSRSFKVLALDKIACDISNIEALSNKFESFKPEIVINCSAYTNVDQAEENKKECYNINHIGVKNISRLCKKYESILFHFSTDYVFDSSFQKPLIEEDLKKPINVYGDSKLEGEIEIINTLENYFIFRVCWVYGRNGKNFPKTILKLAKAKKELKVVCDQLGSPTPTVLIVDIVQNILKKIDSNFKDFGIYHISPNGCCSWHEVACRILEYVSDKSEYVLEEVAPVSSDEFITKAKRPKYSYLDNSKLVSTFDVKVSHWTKYLDRFLNEIGEENELQN